ncbi:ribonuclease E activity regulator RraA [Microbispora bryophytorum]|uniref:4-hydroxy-4-methyl-2-oxoglutarate aldolase n=1 Tax=Microbispora bryophytorum TaxID=1460882 RepID=A0A8H9LHN4_9ACTN|nr:ribonuclease E activity regulator RraA [Microbispora bryophytorum]MBD3136696.1 ribonuclease E activity regulator RraA [Microbispora bryophytorum]TQS06281.1 putative 4-hydroxy-4-methyl-2-oxoglutarate aldolase [Microbispora bryophytorum]GGO17612.1 putative 4-hydroxy-4-methyl-2-oxoglutarate aldolase [Microbispora bryophytorum]
MSFATADLYDAHGDALRSCVTQFRSYGSRTRFSGQIATVRCLEDNALVKQVLATPGEGRVLVADGGGSLRTALLGDMIATSAVENRWAGVVINGAVRDTAALTRLDLGIKALGVNPRKSAKTGLGEIDVPVNFGDVSFPPGAWLYSDEDGILVSDQRLDV